MDVQTISPHRLKELRIEGGEVELIDVRTPAEFREIHADFARNEPLESLDPARVMASRKLNANSPLYVICKTGSRGKMACEKFLAAGIQNIVNVEGGTEAWIEANGPVVRGKKAISLERQVRIAAGTLVFIGTLLGAFVRPVWLILPAFVGGGLFFAGVTDTCGMAMILAKAPWNQVKTPQK